MSLIRHLPGFAQRWLPRGWRQPPPLPERLWQRTIKRHPFLAALTANEQARLRLLSAHFLAEKEFHGANGLVITDAMALAITAQACLPLLHMAAPGTDSGPLAVLDWYADFVGIVVQPGAAVAQREVTDGSGVVHRYREVLAGEAMDRGPIMLSWAEVSHAPDAAAAGHNVVIHEFVHKLDMRGMQAGEQPDGAPPLPPGFAGRSDAGAARQHWRHTMTEAYTRFREAVAMAERFGGERPWLDAYGASHPAEFFAVACEAYFVNRLRFEQEFPELVALFDAFFRHRH
jgi:Mlc titration factor MtfA (ptsG expression regulator)